MFFGFKESVQREIKQICGIDFALDPALCILGILPDNMKDQDLISLVRILPLIECDNSFLVETADPQHIAMERQGKKGLHHGEKSQ